MEIILIAALTDTRVIGADGRIPWRYAADLRHFRRTTSAHPLLMGRTTYESLPQRPLAGRTNIVLSKRMQLPLEPGARHCRSLEQALDWCRASHQSCVFVAGGAQVYRAALPVATGMILTHVPDDVPGDTFFPCWDDAAWEIVGRHREGPLTMITYQRRGVVPTPRG